MPGRARVAGPSSLASLSAATAPPRASAGSLLPERQPGAIGILYRELVLTPRSSAERVDDPRSLSGLQPRVEGVQIRGLHVQGDGRRGSEPFLDRGVVLVAEVIGRRLDHHVGLLTSE